MCLSLCLSRTSANSPFRVPSPCGRLQIFLSRAGAEVSQELQQPSFGHQRPSASAVQSETQLVLNHVHSEVTSEQQLVEVVRIVSCHPYPSLAAVGVSLRTLWALWTRHPSQMELDRSAAASSTRLDKFDLHEKPAVSNLLASVKAYALIMVDPQVSACGRAAAHPCLCRVQSMPVHAALGIGRGGMACQQAAPIEEHRRHRALNKFLDVHRRQVSEVVVDARGVLRGHG